MGSSRLPKEFTATHVREILEQDYGEQTWLVKNLVPAPSISIITGDPGSYKSWICLHLALCVANGDKFLGEFETADFSWSGGVLILDKENHLRNIQRRLQGMNADLSAVIRFNGDQDFTLGNDNDVETLIEYIKSEKIQLLIIDPLSWYHEADENTSREMGSIMRRIKRIAVETEINILLIHHHRKEQADAPNPSHSIRGSSAISGAVDCHIAVSVKSTNDTLIFKQTKLRDAEKHKDFAVKIIVDSEKNVIREFKYLGEYVKNAEFYNEVDTQILELFQEGAQLSFAQIMNELEGLCSEPIGRKRLKTLIYEKKLESKPEGHNKHIYYLPTSKLA